MKMEKGIYKTRDLGEAAALYALGCDLLRLDPSEDASRPKQRTFVFDDTVPGSQTEDERVLEYPRDLAARYRNHDCLVDAHGYFMALREVKSRVYNEQ